jgi:hypothetical protein
MPRHVFLPVSRRRLSIPVPARQGARLSAGRSQACLRQEAADICAGVSGIPGERSRSRVAAAGLPACLSTPLCSSGTREPDRAGARPCVDPPAGQALGSDAISGRALRRLPLCSLCTQYARSGRRSRKRTVPESPVRRRRCCRVPAAQHHEGGVPSCLPRDCLRRWRLRGGRRGE